MADIFFIIIELLAHKFDIDASSSSFRTLIGTTVIIEIIMLIFCGVTLYLKEYWFTIIMLIIMIGVYLFSKKRIQELKEETRGES